MRSKLLPGLLAIAGLIVIGGWLYTKGSRPAGGDASDNAVASTATASAKSARVTAPLPEGPFKTIRPELERLALAGNADAAYGWAQ